MCESNCCSTFFATLVVIKLLIFANLVSVIRHLTVISFCRPAITNELCPSFHTGRLWEYLEQWRSFSRFCSRGWWRRQEILEAGHRGARPRGAAPMLGTGHLPALLPTAEGMSPGVRPGTQLLNPSSSVELTDSGAAEMPPHPKPTF